MPGESVETFDGEITVSSRVIDQLSSGLYESPAACLKELVNNSYDADATNVNLFIRPDAELIIIEDNGGGITRDEFVRHFKRIAQSHKRDSSDRTPSGRPKIGKIGIGFIAANEICDRMLIESTTAGSDELLSVEIDFAIMRDDLSERDRGNDDLAKADFVGTVSHEAILDEHFTRIYLQDVRGEAKDILAGAKPADGEDLSLFGLKPESVEKLLASDRITSWDQFDSYSKACLEIGLNVPVPYFTHWCPKRYENDLKSFTRHAKKLNFTVTVDGTELFKPTVLRDDSDGTKLRTFELKGKHVGGTGYFYAGSGSLRPRDLNGLLIRIRNAGVGGYDDSYIEFPGYTSALFQDWTSGEFWADSRLEDALNIDRRTLRTTHPAYVELRALIHAELRAFLADVRRELYGRRSQRRKTEKASATKTKLDEFSKELVPTIGKASASRIASTWTDDPKSGSGTDETETDDSRDARSKGRRGSASSATRLNRTFSVVQVLEIVSDGARETGLTSKDTAALLEYVTERLLE